MLLEQTNLLNSTGRNNEAEQAYFEADHSIQGIHEVAYVSETELEVYVVLGRGPGRVEGVDQGPGHDRGHDRGHDQGSARVRGKSNYVPLRSTT